jgi:hypothetical protein
MSHSSVTQPANFQLVAAKPAKAWPSRRDLFATCIGATKALDMVAVCIGLVAAVAKSPLFGQSTLE